MISFQLSLLINSCAEMTTVKKSHYKKEKSFVSFSLNLFNHKKLIFLHLERSQLQSFDLIHYCSILTLHSWTLVICCYLLYAQHIDIYEKFSCKLRWNECLIKIKINKIYKYKLFMKFLRKFEFFSQWEFHLFLKCEISKVNKTCSMCSPSSCFSYFWFKKWHIFLAEINFLTTILTETKKYYFMLLEWSQGECFNLISSSWRKF